MKRSLNLLLVELILLSPAVLLAQSGCSGDTICNPLNNTDDFPKLLENITNVVGTIGAVVVVIFIIYSGFLFVSAQGNEEKLTKAKSAFTWTMIGAAVLLGAKAIAIAITATAKSL